jgi:hypothetical protein
MMMTSLNILFISLNILTLACICNKIYKNIEKNIENDIEKNIRNENIIFICYKCKKKIKNNNIIYCCNDKYYCSNECRTLVSSY